jgi:tRNA(adenine34) deaminase
MVGAALSAAEAGLAAGELPIGAVVVMGDEVVGWAYTQDSSRNRRLVHADLLAMITADERLGWSRRPHPLPLAVNLEPCVMCLGAAMTLGIGEVYYPLDSPGDGAASVVAGWQPHPDMPWYAAPVVAGGIRQEESRSLFRRYCRTAKDSGFRRWAETLADHPNWRPVLTACCCPNL